MEALLIRGFVLALALSGFGASTVSSNTASSAKVSANGNFTTPPPTCPAGDPTNCGMD